MELIDKLYREHASILDLARQLRDMTGRTTPPEREAYVDLKMALTRELVAHLTSEDLLIYPRLRRNPDRRIADMATLFIDELGGLRDGVKQWSTHWTYDRIVSEWPRFRTETDALMNRLTARIDRENRQLYPLADAATKTP